MTAPSVADASRVWGRIGLLSFGGPAAQIALMHRIVVEERGWMTERQYLGALSFCMLLPGPEAMQLATYSGWRLHGVRGGLIAGLLFVLPGALVIAVLAWAYAVFGTVPLVAAAFLGIKAAVLAIVLEALLRVARKALKSPIHWIVAALSFVAIYVFAAPFPAIIAAVGLLGFALARGSPSAYTRPRAGQATLRTVIIWLSIWWAPVLAIWVFGGADILLQIGIFFSKLAVVTFGGAYAVLAYMAQDVVIAKEWLTAGQMMDGLGLAETTPGPLILVTEFVGFQAGFTQGGLWLAIAAALLTLWVTFAPCFLWIFAGAPYVDWITEHPRLRGALDAITAAVVGVILNLSLWFALHVLFDTVTRTQIGLASLWIPDPASINIVAVGIAVLSAYLLLVRHLGLGWVLCIAAAAGTLLTLL